MRFFPVKRFGGIHHASPTMVKVAFLGGLPIELSSTILLDTGCTQHMFNKASLFKEIRLFSEKESHSSGVSGIGTAIIRPRGTGEIELKLYVDKQLHHLTLTNVLYCPNLQCNLVSGSQLMDRGCDISLRKRRGCHIRDYAGNLIAEVFNQSGLFLLHTCENQQMGLIAYSSSSNPARRRWHERLGYIGSKNLEKLAEISPGLNLNHIPNDEDCPCTACVRGKMRDIAHKNPLFGENTKPFDIISTDVKGPISNTGYDGSRYFVTFIDAATKYSEVYMMKYKTEVSTHFRHFKVHKELRGYKVLRLHSDGGGEYGSKEFQLEMKEEGIEFTSSTAES